MSHPSYLNMLQRAISSCRDTGKGVSRTTISSYVKNNYNGLAEGSRFEAAINKALISGIDQGLFQKVDKRYKIIQDVYSKRHSDTLWWKETQLKKLSKHDIKQLLITRGEQEQYLKGKKKSEFIELLYNKYTASLEYAWEDLTCNQLMVELRLRGLKDTRANKQILIDRLNDSTYSSNKNIKPPKKKKASKRTASKAKKSQKTNKNKLEWNEIECANWIGGLSTETGYKIYKSKFRSNAITGAFFDEMDDATLADIVKSKLHRAKITHEWERL